MSDSCYGELNIATNQVTLSECLKDVEERVTIAEKDCIEVKQFLKSNDTLSKDDSKMTRAYELIRDFELQLEAFRRVADSIRNDPNWDSSKNTIIDVNVSW